MNIISIILTTILVATAFDDGRLTLTGFGPIRIGMTVEEARRAADIFVDAPPAPADGCAYLRVRNDHGISFMIERGRIVRTDVSDSHHPTQSGLRVGDTEERAKQLYQGRFEQQPHKYAENGHYLIIRSSDRKFALVIETDGRIVTSFRGGSEPAVEYVEGCG